MKYIRELNSEEGWELFDNAARFYLNIGGAEFIGRWNSGYYDENPDRLEVMSVAMLLPFAS